MSILTDKEALLQAMRANETEARRQLVDALAAHPAMTDDLLRFIETMPAGRLCKLCYTVISANQPGLREPDRTYVYNLFCRVVTKAGGRTMTRVFGSTVPLEVGMTIWGLLKYAGDPSENTVMSVAVSAAGWASAELDLHNYSNDPNGEADAERHFEGWSVVPERT